MIHQSHNWVYIQRKVNYCLNEMLHSHIHCSIIYNSQAMEIA